MAKKASFAAASFSNLRAATGEGAGEPLRIALVDIDEDPKQPRQTFDKAELEGLALTIRDKGVLQPIGVLPPADGRYVLVFGARRLRASKLAGQADIPAVIVPEGQRDFTTQVIENQQRANLSNSELAAAVNQLHAEGKQGKEIAAICNLKDYQVAAFRAVEKLPDFLRSRLDQGDIRAIYDLYRAWQKQPDRVEDAMPDEDAFLTITEARRIIAGVTGKATGSVILDRDQAPEDAAPTVQEPVPASAAMRAETVPTSPARTKAEPEKTTPPEVQGEQEQPMQPASPAPARAKEASPESTLASRQVAAPSPARAAQVPVFIMETTDGQQGVLVTDGRPEAPGWAFLDVEGSGRIEAPFIELRCVTTK